MNEIEQKPVPPCKGCKERKAGCAAICQRWKAYYTERNAWYKKMLTESQGADRSRAKRQMTDRAIYKHKGR